VALAAILAAIAAIALARMPTPTDFEHALPSGHPERVAREATRRAPLLLVVVDGVQDADALLRIARETVEREPALLGLHAGAIQIGGQGPLGHVARDPSAAARRLAALAPILALPKDAELPALLRALARVASDASLAQEGALVVELLADMLRDGKAIPAERLAEALWSMTLLEVPRADAAAAEHPPVEVRRIDGAIHLWLRGAAGTSAGELHAAADRLGAALASLGAQHRVVGLYLSHEVARAAGAGAKGALIASWFLAALVGGFVVGRLRDVAAALLATAGAVAVPLLLLRAVGSPGDGGARMVLVVCLAGLGAIAAAQIGIARASLGRSEPQLRAARDAVRDTILPVWSAAFLCLAVGVAGARSPDRALTGASYALVGTGIAWMLAWGALVPGCALLLGGRGGPGRELVHTTPGRDGAGRYWVAFAGAVAVLAGLAAMSGAGRPWQTMPPPAHAPWTVAVGADEVEASVEALRAQPGVAEVAGPGSDAAARGEGGADPLRRAVAGTPEPEPSSGETAARPDIASVTGALEELMADGGPLAAAAESAGAVLRAASPEVVDRHVYYTRASVRRALDAVHGDLTRVRGAITAPAPDTQPALRRGFHELGDAQILAVRLGGDAAPALNGRPLAAGMAVDRAALDPTGDGLPRTLAGGAILGLLLVALAGVVAVGRRVGALLLPGMLAGATLLSAPVLVGGPPTTPATVVGAGVAALGWLLAGVRARHQLGHSGPVRAFRMASLAALVAGAAAVVTVGLSAPLAAPALAIPVGIAVASTSARLLT
jgi:hypothetical protein